MGFFTAPPEVKRPLKELGSPHLCTPECMKITLRKEINYPALHGFFVINQIKGEETLLSDGRLLPQAFIRLGLILVCL